MKNIREIALTSYYPYGRNKEKIIAERIFKVDEALDKYGSVIRADERKKVLHEQRALDVNLQISAEKLRADERRKFAESLRKFICKENCGERRCVDKFDECVWVGYIDEFLAEYEKEQK